MGRVLLINAAEVEETRAAVVADGRLEEYRCERSATANLVGNIYLGRVVNLERGIGAAFVDVGVGRNGFLHASDCVGAGDDDRIETLVSLGQQVLVQVTRESIGSKGPVLTMNVSLAGHFLVLLPLAEEGGVSRRIEEDEERTRMRALARELEQRAGAGLIVRTAGVDRTKKELLRDLKTLRRVWDAVTSRAASVRVPALLYAESDLVARALRDLADPSLREIRVDTPEASSRAKETLATIRPELADRVVLHPGPMPLFHAAGIEEEIDTLRSRRVPLPGGGSIVFDTTEALVAVDVNSGRMRAEEGLEETALQTNLEAAVAVARQLRLRDLGGVVVVDFIDMKDPEHVRRVEQAFREQLRRDRARVRPSRIAAFGVFVLTRRRAGEGAAGGRRPCPHCGGTGAIVAPEEVALRVFRELAARATRPDGGQLRARLSPEVAEILRSMRAGSLAALAEETGRPVLVEPDASLPPGGWEVEDVRAP